MKADTIVTMLSDPNIDPTSWVGEALVEWIGKNLDRCLNDSVARDYLFRGMDSTDMKVVSDAVIPIYKETLDPTIIKKFIDGCNSVTARTHNDYSHKWGLEKVARDLNKVVGPNTVDHVVQLQMPEGDQGWHADLTEHMKDYHVPDLLRNRLLRWGAGGFKDLIELTPEDKVLDLFQKSIWEKHLLEGRGQSWPKSVQDILYHLFLRLPGDQAPRWMQWLEKTDVHKLWGSCEGLVSKSLVGIAGIKFGETICRCGAIMKSRSGSTLHRKRCKEGELPNLYITAKIFLADNNSKLLICNKCGKTCKSQPGLALHRKKCQSEVGTTMRANRCGLKMRLLREAENANKTENTVS